jgi:hypothetical protein
MTWAEPLLVCSILLVTAGSTARLALAARLSRPTWHGDLAHAVMGAGMVAMLAPVALPSMWWAGAFVASAAWLGWLALRAGSRASYLHHVVASLAMAYMFAAARPHQPASHLSTHPVGHVHGTTAAVDGHAAGFAFPLVAWGLAVYCALSAGYAATDLLRRNVAGPAAATEFVLSSGMVYMFLTML